MATDGVKIIDGDTAHDIYEAVMDLYDSGATIETIRSKYPFPQSDYYDDFDCEIYTTAYALAMWEIGHLTDDVLQEVKRVIDKGACVKTWTEECDAKAGKARQKELDKLLTKISSVNQKVRKARKYKTISNFLFAENDVLVFQLPDKNYYATLLFKINQYRGRCTYEFGKVLYKGSEFPTLETIASAAIIGRKIPSGHGMDMTSILSMGIEEMMKQGGIEEILKRESEKTGSFVIGMDRTAVEHNNLSNFKDQFQKIGQLKIKHAYKNTGSYRGASGFDELTSAFPDLENYIRIFKADRLKIADLLEQ